MALPSPEEVLLYRIQQQNEGLLSPEAVGTMGAAVGAVAGAAAGSIPHQIGRGINAVAGRQGNRFKPGLRLAGGLLGSIMGGGLGLGMRQQAINNSPEARLLAELQINGGQVSPEQTYALQSMLEDTYRQIGVG